MIFISAISEMEAIMGDDEKLIRDILTTAEKLHPEFIAIVGAPIPYMIGTDLKAIAMIVEARNRDSGVWICCKWHAKLYRRNFHGFS